LWTEQRLVDLWLRVPFSLGIPLVLVSTPILLALRSTRGLALAALPLQVYLLWFAGHKHAYYFLHEISIFGAAMVIGTLSLADRALARLPWHPLRRIILTVVAATLGLALVLGKWNAKHTEIVPEAREHEAEVARAAGREMLGPNARVGSRIGIWYASGAAHWHNVAPDLLWSALPRQFDVADYVSRLDAVAEYHHSSEATSNKRNTSLSSWYAEGTLQLRGFFFAETNPELNYLLLQGKRPSSISGFALRRGQLYRFQEDVAGNHEAVSLACPERQVNDFSLRVPFYSVLDLPESNPAGTRHSVITALVPPDGPRDYASLYPDCRVVQSIRGFLLFADRKELVTKLRREDKPMRFYRELEDVPGAGRRVQPATPAPPSH
jgi:hypothetical protein